MTGKLADARGCPWLCCILSSTPFRRRPMTLKGSLDGFDPAVDCPYPFFTLLHKSVFPKIFGSNLYFHQQCMRTVKWLYWRVRTTEGLGGRLNRWVVVVHISQVPTVGAAFEGGTSVFSTELAVIHPYKSMFGRIISWVGVIVHKRLLGHSSSSVQHLLR